MTVQLDALLEDAAARIGPTTSCSLLLRHRGGLTRVASGDGRAARCDDVEARDSYGPCVLAMDTLQGVLVPDLDVEERWPAWRAEAQAVGFRSAAAMPGYVGHGSTVALNLYSDELDPWDPAALVRADQVVQEIVLVLDAHLFQ